MRILLATIALLVSLPGAAYAADVLINNGLDCSNPGNVIDHATYQNDFVFVRNVGCGTPDPGSPCPSPGAATEVCVVDGGDVYRLYSYDTSTVTMSGGEVGRDMHAYHSSTVTMSGGTVGGFLYAYDSATVMMSGESVVHRLLPTLFSTVMMSGGSVVEILEARRFANVTMSGGTVGGVLSASDRSSITIIGSGFELDGSPVPYGDLGFLLHPGWLTGTLASGEPIDNGVCAGVIAMCMGTITLAPAAAIDIRPWSKHNFINPFSQKVFPVAMLGSDDFHVEDADVTTLAFGPNGAEPAFDLTNPFVYWLAHQDVNRDGKKDLLSYYQSDETGVAIGDTKACLTGETLDGTPFMGCDAISTVSCGLGVELVFLMPALMWLRRWRRRKLG